MVVGIVNMAETFWIVLNSVKKGGRSRNSLGQMCTATCSASRGSQRTESEQSLFCLSFYRLRAGVCCFRTTLVPHSTRRGCEDFLLLSFSRRKTGVCCVYRVHVVDHLNCFKTCEESVVLSFFSSKMTLCHFASPSLSSLAPLPMTLGEPRAVSTWLGHCVQIFGQEWSWMFLWECLWVRFTFEIGELWVKQIILHNEGAPHPISWSPGWNKRLTSPKQERTLLQKAFGLELQYRLFLVLQPNSQWIWTTTSALPRSPADDLHRRFLTHQPP